MNLSRDKAVTRYINRLFWRALTRNKLYFTLTATMHAPFFFVQHVYMPLQIAYGIEAIFRRSIADVTHHVWLLVIGAIVGNILFAIATWAFNRNGITSHKEIQRQVFSNFLSKDYDFYANHYVGSLGSHASQLREAINQYDRLMFFDIPKAAVTVIAGLVVIAFGSPVLALVTVIAMMLILAHIVLFSNYRLPYRRKVSQAASVLSGVIGDALSHGVTVKSYANETHELKRLEGSLDAWGVAQLKSWDLFTPFNSVRNLMVTACTALLLIVSARLYIDGTISVAVVVLVQLYVVKIMMVAVDIGEIIKAYELMMGMAYQPAVTMMITSEVLDPKEPRELPDNHKTSVQLDDVSYRYPDAKHDKQAIEHVSITIQSGEKIGIVGYSGSGKTTLTKLLLRFMDVESGTIRINGVDIRQARQADVRSLISYVPQEPLLFHRSIKENISYATPHANESAILKAAKAAYVDEFVAELPDGYNTLVGERGVKLSGGQRQRVALARAILKNAPILVLDEATSALDSQSEVFVQKALWKLMKDRTAIVVAHRLSTIQKMDRIVVMDKGKIVAVGAHQELLSDKNGIYAQLWAHQSGGYIGLPEGDSTGGS